MSAQDSTTDPQEPIAIVGMAGRFPGAADVDAFWRLLVARGDAIRPVPADRRDATAQLDPENTVQAVGGFIDGIDEFDPTFFGISPREAEDIDPQHRLMLEVTWQAVEDADRPAASLRGSRTGVYVGASWHDYEILRKERGALATQHTAVGNALDVIAARVSYFLKLKGPSLTVETGCSSSLVALHLACQALRSGEIEGALVGGVNLILAPDVSVALTRFGGLSPDGRCKTFAASANGFVRGEGVIAVYVKTLARALADGDRIHGVVVGTAVNNDGGGDSLVTPNPAGQEDLLTRAYAEARISVDEVAYVEAHGTGTAVGDPIEAGVIGRTLGQLRDRARGPLAIGSVKTNIGHLEATAGLAGLVKTVLSLAHRVVPPNLHGDLLNPAIPFDALNLRVVREPLMLPADGPIYAGVNSFGWGGTNAHVILRSAPSAVATDVGAGAERSTGALVVVPLSAHNDESLRQRAADVQAVIASAAVPIADLAATLACKRDQFQRRAAFVVESAAELESRLASFTANPADEIAGVVSGVSQARGRTAFIFAGQGSQWLGMGRDLFATSPTFAAVIRRCAAALAPYIAWDLVACISGEAGPEWSTRVDMLQPMLWATSVALAELWREAGVEPDVVVGHSQGEVAAATIAGILSYEDAARVVARRSAIIRRKSGHGLMLAVDLDVAGARAALAGFEDRVSLAVNNGPTSCVLSGDADAVTTLKELIEADGSFCRLVQVDYASHSHQMDELKAELLAALDGIAPQAAKIALVSTVLVKQLGGAEMDASYWVRNLREPVLFADVIGRLFDEGVTHVVEISPHPVLTPAIEQIVALQHEPVSVLSTLHRNAGAQKDFAQAMARAFVAGLAPFHRLRKNASVRLPAYPWQRKKYWVTPSKRRGSPKPGLEIALLPAAGDQDAWQGTLDVGLDEQPWLKDHKVHDAVVLPGAAMLALALSAARSRTGSVPRTLVDVRFLHDLTLGDEPARVSASWRDDVTCGGSFALMSLAAGATSWTEHATARVYQGAQATPHAAFPEHLRATHAENADAFYSGCAARGLHYGPAFQGVVRVFVDGDAALGEVRLPEVCRSGVRSHGLHPALWDAALQVCLALCQGGRTVVPTAVTRIAILQDVSKPVTTLWSHVVRRDATRFDLVLFDADEQPLMALQGLALEPLAVALAVSDTDRVHRLQFHEEVRATAAAHEAAWVVCGEATDGAQALNEALNTALGGGRARLAQHTSRGEDPHASAWLDTIRDCSTPAGIVFVAPRASAGIVAQRRGLLALTALVKACAALATPPRLVVVTAEAQAALDDDQPDPGAALYWGFARVIRREHAELQPLVVDVASADEGWAADCAAELLAIDGEDQVALRTGRRFVGRLVRGEVAAGTEKCARAWTTPRQPFRLRAARPGSWDGLEYRPLCRRSPAAGEIEVEVTASGLNFIDVMKAMGTYPGLEGRAALLGGECAGRVVAVGPELTTMAVGDRVVACTFGSFASHVTVRADHAQLIPGDIEDQAAAGLPLVLSTAWYGLHDLAQLAAGESVLIHSATGGLGLAAIQVARVLGARILATAGSEPKRSYLHTLGIAEVFDSRDLSWVDGVAAATNGKGVDVVLNSLAGAAIPLGLDVLAEGGRFIEVGKQDIYGGRMLHLAAFKKGISLAAVDLAGLMERRPERFARLFAAAWAHVRSAAIRPLPTTAYPFAEVADALRTMARGNHIGKLVLTAPDTVHNIAPEAMPQGRFRGDATYLITGGLGALGLSLAEFMAERGAGALALAGRSVPSVEASRRIAALRARGVRVEAIALDVADAHAVDRALAGVRCTMPALRGVVHAAGLLDDATIANLTALQLERVLAPKIDGARYLDAATAGDPLDLFVMFSSAAALVGNTGQAAYAAGNAFLDALAVARRRHGRPGLSVQWGPFTEIGLAAHDGDRGARLAERGMVGFTPGEAWSALVRFLHRDEAVVGYVPLDLRRWFDAYPETAAQNTWQMLRQASQQGCTVVAGDTFRAQLEASPEPTRRDLAEAKVRELASRVLHLDLTEIDRETPFKALGLDSLMGLELRNRLESAFGLKLSPTLLWTYGSSHALAGVLCERVFSAPAS
ncbi:MAG: SDR family NAD(P)-dependent oxidoreductase [Deltaproteobacteria bacterium]|nr:MAG: SDR family NAD(P)-dependent oxidoreductase [Deltaproteobacteria bacterium]